jgi:hypothetical protein
MIRAAVMLNQDGELLRFSASGHAGGGPPGFDIVCAAFTMLARTAFSALSGLPGASLEGQAASPGELWFAVTQIPDDEKQKAAGMTIFLLEGLDALARDFPAEFCMTVERKWRK